MTTENVSTLDSKCCVTTSLKPLYNRSPCLWRTIVYAFRYSSSKLNPELFFFWISWIAFFSKFHIPSTYLSSIVIWNRTMKIMKREINEAWHWHPANQTPLCQPSRASSKNPKLVKSKLKENTYGKSSNSHFAFFLGTAKTAFHHRERRSTIRPKSQMLPNCTQTPRRSKNEATKKKPHHLSNK